MREVGDRVLVFSRDFGKRPGLDTEVELKASAVWTVRDGRIARAEFFALRSDALRVVGLEETR
jgi:ketosteroid isomerase-like protein